VRLAVKLPSRSPLTATAAPVPWRLSLPARLQEPVLPATSTFRPGGEDPGRTEEMTGVAVTVTETVANGQARPAASASTGPLQ
jgi:hypothetical protein